MKLYKESGEAVGYFDVLKWINENYPEDIFILENPEFLEIRDRARSLLIKQEHYAEEVVFNKKEKKDAKKSG